MSTFQANMQLTIQQHVPGNSGLTRPIDNVLNYGCQAPLGVVGTSVFLTAWRASLETLWLACHDYSCILDDYIVKSLDNPALAQLEVTLGSHGSYNSTPGAPAPSINSAFFFFKSLQSGRSSHGGMHMGGLPAAGITGNEFNNTFSGILNAWFAPFLAGFTDASLNVWQPIILSRKGSSLVMPPPAVNVVAAAVNSTRSFLDLDVGTMRRRKERTAR